MASGASGSLEVKEKGISDDLLRSFYAVFSSRAG